MSEYNDSESCPNCGLDMESYSDHKPFSYTDHTCMHCGLMIMPLAVYMDLEDLNIHREDRDMKPLDELPEQNWEIP